MLSSANAFLHTCCTIQLHSPMCSPIRQIIHSFQMSSKMNWVTIQQKGIGSVSTRCMAFMLVCGRWYNFKKRCHGFKRRRRKKKEKRKIKVVDFFLRTSWSPGVEVRRLRAGTSRCARSPISLHRSLLPLTCCTTSYSFVASDVNTSVAILYHFH